MQICKRARGPLITVLIDFRHVFNGAPVVGNKVGRSTRGKATLGHRHRVHSNKYDFPVAAVVWNNRGTNSPFV